MGPVYHDPGGRRVRSTDARLEEGHAFQKRCAALRRCANGSKRLIESRRLTAPEIAEASFIASRCGVDQRFAQWTSLLASSQVR
jgi:hypothetical protein